MKKDNHGQYFSSEHDYPRPRVLVIPENNGVKLST